MILVSEENHMNINDKENLLVKTILLEQENEKLKAENEELRGINSELISMGNSMGKGYEKENQALRELVREAIPLIDTDKGDYSLKNAWFANAKEWLEKAKEITK